LVRGFVNVPVIHQRIEGNMRLNLILASGIFALAGTSSLALAADIQPENPVFLSGAFEIGAWLDSYSQTDDPDAATVFGGYASAFANASLADAVTLGVDIQGEFLPSIASPFKDHTGTFEGAIGANLVYHANPINFGVFGAVGKTNSQPSDDGLGLMGGAVLGLDVSEDTLLYTQVGYADIRVDQADSGFSGWFADGGVIHAFSDQFAVRVAGAYGYASQGYEDTPDWGSFWDVGIKGAYAISDTSPIFLTASYNYSQFTANTEDDGHEHNFKLGLSIGFGGTQKAKDTFNPYGTPLLPFRSAAYGEVLD
jgi:hypothetical protein